VKTAGLIREAQSPKGSTESVQDVLEVTQLRVLMEQDFGDLEGKKWSEMQAELQNKPGYVAVETKEAMGQRADIFLDEYFLPLFDGANGETDPVIAIVSHGVFLSTLWKRLLRRLPAKSISLSPGLQSTARPLLGHLGGWSNTGYLELHMARDETEKSSISADAAPSPTSELDMSQPVDSNPDDIIGAVDALQVVPQEATGSDGTSSVPTDDVAQVVNTAPAVSAPPTPSTPRTSGSRIARGWKTTVLTVNGKDHLKGLKRTGGGVGSSRHDASQKGIESFFKRRKVIEKLESVEIVGNFILSHCIGKSALFSFRPLCNEEKSIFTDLF
jgi:hypothetical protein